MVPPTRGGENGGRGRVYTIVENYSIFSYPAPFSANMADAAEGSTHYKMAAGSVDGHETIPRLI